MKTVAVFGGSFSPVHAGHVQIAESIARRGLADEVWLVPCRLNPLKDGTTPMDDVERLEMLRAAAAEANGRLGREALKVNDIELGMPSPSYTCHTMQRLVAENPGVRFRLVAGGDSYLGFDRWREWEWLESNFSPIVYPRPGYEMGKDSVRAGWTMLGDVPLNEASSTRIREMWASGETVPPEWGRWLGKRRRLDKKETPA